MKELIYKYQIHVFSDNDKEIAMTTLGTWEFPSDEEIMKITEENGGAYAKVERIYVPDEIPFSEG